LDILVAAKIEMPAPEMQPLRLSHAIIMIAGCFRPLSWTSSFKRVIYNAYRLYIIGMVYTFVMLQLMDIALNVRNPDEFTDNLKMALMSSAACYKAIAMWINYENITILINYIIEEPFKPLDQNEINIRKQFDKIIR
jgi:threonine/homoserine efflux transporter RhtA